MIKLISSDMDGTLLDSYRQITPINVEAIKRAQENGINFIINTGREYPNARGLVEAAGLKCDLICSNGACAFDKDGNLCPNVNQLVKFKVKGAGTYRAGANGDPISMDLFHLPQMTLFNGMLTAIVQTTDKAGEIILEATSKDLKNGKVILNSK